ncbi:MAG: hypothetical protein JJU31_14835 [Wenzhouxiangella sp.]|nr:hypothetical protein [Wenzhouxiangella sp.]MCH8479299.1 hypothetical protein [Wenzhouxiangella sp.]TVR96032.1 MAG: hypothetical protein EA418_06150 [Wenzhouxiangellaceae bacterium]
MLQSVRHRILFFATLVLLIQVAMPWHMLHMQAVAAQADASSIESPEYLPDAAVAHQHVGSHCHPPAAMGDEPGHIAGFCEWLCAQGQTAPFLDSFLVRGIRPSDALPQVIFGSDQLPDSVPTPPPIA